MRETPCSECSRRFAAGPWFYTEGDRPATERLLLSFPLAMFSQFEGSDFAEFWISLEHSALDLPALCSQVAFYDYTLQHATGDTPSFAVRKSREAAQVRLCQLTTRAQY